MLETDPVPGSLRNRVLAESGGRCALCGATNKERPLDVDHIRPRSKGGGNEYANLQVLCSKCNRAKGNKEDTDYRAIRKLIALGVPAELLPEPRAPGKPGPKRRARIRQS